jgi:hypothetical protein
MEKENTPPRSNIMDRYAWSPVKALDRAIKRLRGDKSADPKEERYGRGPLVSKTTVEFFPKN